MSNCEIMTCIQAGELLMVTGAIPGGVSIKAVGQN